MCSEFHAQKKKGKIIIKKFTDGLNGFWNYCCSSLSNHSTGFLQLTFPFLVFLRTLQFFFGGEKGKEGNVFALYFFGDFTVILVSRYRFSSLSLSYLNMATSQDIFLYTSVSSLRHITDFHITSPPYSISFVTLSSLSTSNITNHVCFASSHPQLLLQMWLFSIKGSAHESFFRLLHWKPKYLPFQCHPSPTGIKIQVIMK